MRNLMSDGSGPGLGSEQRSQWELAGSFFERLNGSPFLVLEEAQVIRRDLKPSNVILARDGRARLAPARPSAAGSRVLPPSRIPQRCPMQTDLNQVAYLVSRMGRIGTRPTMVEGFVVRHCMSDSRRIIRLPSTVDLTAGTCESTRRYVCDASGRLDLSTGTRALDMDSNAVSRGHFACNWLLALFTLLAPVATGHAAEQEAPRYSILPVQVAFPTGLSINNRRMVVGTSYRVDENGEGTPRGFALLERFLDPIDFVEKQGDVLDHAIVLGQNDRGEIVGLLGFKGASEIGFRHSLGKVESINIPDASLSPTPQDINNSGDVVGWVQILSPTFFGEPGFLFSGGRVTLFMAPDAKGPPSSMRPFGMNDKREIVGCYEPKDVVRTSFVSRGFLLRNDAYTRIHVPNALATCAFDINNRGTIVGSYTDAAELTHGFVLRNGRFTTIDIPNATLTTIVSMNDSGDIVGFYYIGFRQHAFRSNISEFINRN
jgi:hypothetical protein